MFKLGIDMTSISRFEGKPDTFVKRILSENEYKLYLETETDLKALFLARAWAIKEAIFKANNAYANFSQVELYKLDKVWRFKNFSISITHENDTLIAMVVEND
ncbi:4'-phosphopantetheinyl transferase superfamily protein [Mycoplasma corogypsi]|uniref:4'-phosphopantetheinyl transferase superfamily protein n=1 Tax=Mycoplasma corogypsi TaxID=2106 RepID=UPI003873984A